MHTAPCAETYPPSSIQLLGLHQLITASPGLIPSTP